MSIKKDIFAPLASGLGATRRAAMLLLVMMLTMAQTAWADNINVATAAGFGTLTDGKYTLVNGNTYTLIGNVNTGGYIYVPAGVTATIDLAGYTIDRGLTSEMTNGSVIIVEGTLTITDASTGGKIQGGYDAGDGYLYTTSCVKVLEGATFNLQGGTLIGRVQDYDYTVSVVENSNFTMTCGKITGGETGVLALGNVSLTGGEISGNNMGVRVGKNFSISGNPVITGNTEMNADLRTSGGIRKINITGALTDGANIGITVRDPTDNSPVTVTSGYNTYNSVSPDTYFSLDNDGQIQTSPFDYMTVVMGWNEDKTEIAVGTALYTVNFDINGHGDAIDAVSLLSGYKVAEPTEPTADDWFFVDWFTDDACTTGNEWNFDNAVTSNMTLHALWTQEAIYSFTLPEKMVIVSTTNAPVGGKYPVGTVIKFKVSSADYVVDGDVSDGTNTLTPDGDGNYTVTMGDADITITATVKKVVEPNKTLSGSDSYTAQNGDVLTGSTSGTVTIANNAKITLSDVTITGGIVCEGTADITLVGTNSVTGASLKAGIQVGGSGTTLTIKGNGSLTANGGSQSAGIGLSRAWDVDAMGGDIVIEGGNITATGDDFGAGIGTGVSYGNGTDNTATIGNITIKGGTVKAIGGTNQFTPGSGIGKGGAYSNGHAVVGTITIYDGIDMVDASSISESIVYMHETTDVTESKADYFTIGEDGNRRLIVQKLVIADIPDQTYTGSAITPEPLVQTGSLILTKGTDYTYSYENNTDAGTATVRATFQGTYASLGYVEKEFKIVKSMTNNDITVTIPSQTYTGSAIEPAVTVKDGETTLTLGTDYEVAYSNNVNAGTATVAITGKGNYSDSKEATFTIKAKETNCGAITLVEDQNGVTAIFDGTSDESITITDDIEVNSVTYNRTFTDGKPATVMLPFSLGEGQTQTGGRLYKFTGVTKNETAGKWEATMTETATLQANTPYLLMPDDELTDGKVTFDLNNGTVILNTTGGGNRVTADEGSHWTFKGTYEYKEWISGGANAEEIGRAYGFAGVAKDNIDVGDFVKVANGAKIRPMCCYLLWNNEPNSANARSFTRGAAATDEELPQRITVRLVGSNGETTAIGTLDTTTGEVSFDGWYTLDGVKLNGKPTARGIYINNGKKIVIK